MIDVFVYVAVFSEPVVLRQPSAHATTIVAGNRRRQTMAPRKTTGTKAPKPSAGLPGITAVAISVLPGGTGEGQVSKETLRSLRKRPPAAMGRQLQFMTIGCSRPAPKPSRPLAVLRERPLSPSRLCLAEPAKVKFQGRPVAR